MKKLFSTSIISITILIIITVGLIHQPTSAVSGSFDPSPFGTSCYHVVDGVREPTPYTLVFGTNSCPSWMTQPEAASDDALIDALKTANGLPPHLCQEIGLPEW